MNGHVLSGARGIVLSGARLSCYQAQERAQVLGPSGGFRSLTLITYRSFGSVITEEGRSCFVDALRAFGERFEDDAR